MLRNGGLKRSKAAIDNRKLATNSILSIANATVDKFYNLYNHEAGMRNGN
jgi:hypothetical protein